MVNLDTLIESDRMQTCPICDNAMLEYEEIRYFTVNGAVGIAHKDCIIEALLCYNNET